MVVKIQWIPYLRLMEENLVIKTYSMLIIVIINRKLILPCSSQMNLRNLQWWYGSLSHFIFIELCDTTSVFIFVERHTANHSVRVVDVNYPFQRHFLSNCGQLGRPITEGKGPQTLARGQYLASCLFLCHLWAQNAFYVFKSLGKIKRRIFLCHIKMIRSWNFSTYT